MSKNLARLIFTSTLFAASCLCVTARTPAPAASPSSVSNENDRERDGLQGPVRRVRVETAKLVYKSGKLVEGDRATLETATYDMKGAKIDNAYFLSPGGAALTGKETYKYDDRGNIVEMTLLNADGSVVMKEKYDLEFDAMGNWTKMLTSVAIIENGQMKFEPTEVTHRFISYFLEESVAKKLQTGQQQHAPAAGIVPASASAPLNAPAANNTGGVAAAPKTQPKAAAKTPAPPPAALARTSAASATLVAPDRMPNAVLMTASGAPVVRADDDLPPPVKKAPLRPISGGVLNGRAVSLPAPAYPETARRVRATGTVSVEVVVDVNGRVISAKATSGPMLLREVSERAAMQAKFTPALLTGQPIKVSGLINYSFVF